MGLREWERRDRAAGRYEGQFRPEFSRLHYDPDLLWLTPLPIRYIVGVIGFRAAGKSEALHYLAEKRGFEVHSLSRVVRVAAERQGFVSPPRAVLQSIGDELRAAHRPPPTKRPGGTGRGDGAYLARLTLRELHQRHHSHHASSGGGVKIALTGFKHPDELALFRRLQNFRTLIVQAEDLVRADRAVEKGMLARELDELGLELPAKPSLNRREKGGSAAWGDYEEQLAQLFDEHLDRRDRDGHKWSPWAGRYPQAVDLLMTEAEAECAAEDSTSEHEVGLAAQPARTIYTADNNQDFSDDSWASETSLYSQLERLVERLDREFRVG